MDTMMMLLAGGFTLEAMLPILIKLIVAGLIAYVAFWGVSKIGLPEPFGKIILAIIVLIIVIYLITLLASIG